jgi:hypothetical protein
VRDRIDKAEDMKIERESKMPTRPQRRYTRANKHGFQHRMREGGEGKAND